MKFSDFLGSVCKANTGSVRVAPSVAPSVGPSAGL